MKNINVAGLIYTYLKIGAFHQPKTKQNKYFEKLTLYANI